MLDPRIQAACRSNATQVKLSIAALSHASLPPLCTSRFAVHLVRADQTARSFDCLDSRVGYVPSLPADRWGVAGRGTLKHFSPPSASARPRNEVIFLLPQTPSIVKKGFRRAAMINEPEKDRVVGRRVEVGVSLG